MDEASNNPTAILSQQPETLGAEGEPRLDVTLQSPVKPEFLISEDGGRTDKGCVTLVIVTEETEINVCFDSHDREYLDDLGKAITKAGGVKASGELGFGRA